MKTRRTALIVLIAITSLFGLSAMIHPAQAAAQGKKLHFIYVDQWGPGNLGIVAIKKGMEDAAAQLGVDAEMLFVPQDDDLAAQVSNLESAIEKNPDGIIATIPNPTAFNSALQRALDKGIPIVGANTNALIGTGSPLLKKIPFVGSDLFGIAYEVAERAVGLFPDITKIHCLVGVESPGAAWAEQRAGGSVKYLEEKKIRYEKLDISTDMATCQARVSAYLERHPETNLIITQGGFSPAPVAKALKAVGKKPGEVINVGYDVFVQTVQEFRSGYITFVYDQQIYLQGYLPVLELYFMKKYSMTGWDANTGHGFVDKNNIEQVADLAMQHVR